MSSPQPPADGDRPTDTESGAAEPTTAPAASPAPAKRTTTPRKRTPKTTAISPDGEAPEILDAMLGKASTEDTVAEAPAKPATPRRRTAASRAKAAAAPDTSTSPAEPPVAAAAPDDVTEPLETEAATAVLPTADDFYRAPTTETEILNPAGAAAATTAGAEPVRTETLPASAAAEPVPVGAVSEDTLTDGAATTTAVEDAPPAPAAGPHAPRPGRNMNDLADRLDDSRFFSSLFDFTFTSYVTRKLAGPVYVVGLVLIGLGIVVGFANSLGIAIATRSPVGAFVFLLGVLVTLVAAILSVLLLRVTIEVFCAIIEIAQNTRRRRPPRD
ncbi:DUF4282 domain-containing protein [Leifsonia shinshuensis]|uniref:DUF4282 domain-containing protein n=1 Tax=Leifsonia shinshuensis TaxID=150026 RepID=A0A7G6Y6Z5_9MICO|nr:DUF4282 domain-containing protein [Leifsonia shinshuensis]QNE34260.1 DUF4282 domain-containing protein [Leifsonia shinshuensis]